MSEPTPLTDLWADLEAEAAKPGPTMTITKAQYAALLARSAPSLDSTTTTAQGCGHIDCIGLASCAAALDAAIAALRENP